MQNKFREGIANAPGASITILFLLLCVGACSDHPTRNVHRSFYYWRSQFIISPAELSNLQKLKVENLYVKFFDVTWNNISNTPQPVAPIRSLEHLPPGIQSIPVIFITHESLQKTTTRDIDTLAKNIIKLVAAISLRDHLPAVKEIQFDCDWTPGTRVNYFHLLSILKELDYCKNKTISVTIRLHQLKFLDESGIPPVDKGLLMCYNMGDLRQAATHNSIIDPAELKKYISRLAVYPLPLDIAMPLFDWWVWFRGPHYKGLIHGPELPYLKNQKNIDFLQDSTIGGFTFAKGDWLRYENSPAKSLLEVESLLRPKINQKEMNVILFSLDENNLSKYTTNELESFFDGLH